jgi:hypothetical protein
MIKLIDGLMRIYCSSSLAWSLIGTLLHQGRPAQWDSAAKQNDLLEGGKWHLDRGAIQCVRIEGAGLAHIAPGFGCSQMRVDRVLQESRMAA